MTINLCSERGVKPRLARDLWQQCERDTPLCDSFYTKRNKLPSPRVAVLIPSVHRRKRHGVLNLLHTLPCAMPFPERGIIFSVDMRSSEAYDAPHSHALPETLVHERADLTQPHRLGDTDTESVRGQSPDYEGTSVCVFCLVGKTAQRRRSGVLP